MNRKLSISLLAGAALGIASAASAQTNRDEGLALSAEIAAQNAAMANSLQAANAPEVFGFTKFRYNFNSRDDVPGIPGAEDTAQGFTNAETRLGVQGSVDNWDYVVSGSFGTDGDFELADASVVRNMDNGWSARFGQFRAAFMREDAVDETGYLAMNTSLTHLMWTMDRVQGTQWRYASEDWRFAVSGSDGARSANTDFTSAAESDFSITGRFEYKIRGADWDVFNDFTSFQGSDPAYMAGAAIQYQTGGNSFATPSGSTSDTDILGVTADFSAEGNGWNAFAAFVYVTIEPEFGADRDDYGFVAQGGYFLNASWEGFARIEQLSPDSPLDDFMAVSFGVNKYFIPESQAAKLTVAADFFTDAQSKIGVTSTEHNLLSSTSDSQWGLRAQVQLVF